MKKIININLSGRVIPIEDAAYDSLQRYIDSLRRYFANEEGRDEIINDIESRIAELMNDKIKKGAAAVTEADIEEIIASMGRVEDFEQAEGNEGTASGASAAGSTAGDYGQGAYSNEGRRFSGRLYRDSSDRIIGGVCAGIANYVNIDPAMVRLLFAIITFGGFGFGFLIYLVLWIILPQRPLVSYVGKRLFRNPDDRVIGGVAGGLGAYFNKKPWTIRLIFAAPLILNIFISVLNGLFWPWNDHFHPVDWAFGSLTGTFILTYIILWIVLPEARSPFEKMEMRGEKVDVNSIRQNVQEGMGDFKTRMTAWGEEVKASAESWGARASEFANTRGKTFASEAARTAQPVASGLGHAIGVLFKAFFLFIFGSIAFGLFVGLIVLIFGGGTVVWPLKQSLMNFVLDGFWQKTFFWGTVILFLAVPLIGFITWLVRRIMRVRAQKHYLGWIFGGLWTLGWVCAIGLASSLARDFRSNREVEQNITLAQPAGTLLVQVSEPPVLFNGDWFFDEDDGIEGWNLTEDSLQLSHVQIRIDRSADSSYGLTLVRESRGRNGNEAIARARNIRYNVASRDSVLDLGSGYSIGKEDKFRAQEVTVEIRVPVGRRIRFDQSIIDRLHNVQLRGNGPIRNRDLDYHYYPFPYRTDVDYIMNADGELTPADGSVAEPPRTIDTYRYNSDSLDQAIQERERQLEQERREIERLRQERIREEERRRSEQNTTQVPARRKVQPADTLPFFSVLIV